MPSDVQSAPESKKMLWAGRVVTTLLVLMVLVSASMKLIKPDGIVTEFKRLGYPESLVLAIGLLEILCVVVYAIPRTAVLGAILMTGYLGGAVATHVRIGEQFFGPVVGGMLVWLGLYLRDARIRDLIPLRR